MTVSPLKENTNIPDRTFPINVFRVGGIYPHWHDHIEWVYVKEGMAKVQIDGSFEQIGKGELAFINSGQLHSAATLTPDTELICIVFNEALVRGSGLDVTEYHYFMPYLQQQQRWPSWVRQDASCMDELGDAFERLLSEFGQKLPGYELMVKAELLRIFGLYFRYAEQFMSEPAARPYNPHDFTSLLKTLRERYCEAITIGEAAALVNLSPNHFCKLFKKVTGKTFIDYIHTLRVQEAERLLLESDLPVTEIAELVGFSTITYFGRVFRKIRSQSPSSIRRDRVEARADAKEVK